MGQSDFDSQFSDILSEGQFSEMASITIDGSAYCVSGIFFSGSYDEASAVAYQPKKLVGRDYFQFDAGQLVDVEKPWEVLKGATLESLDRGSFRIYDISGRRMGVLTLELQEVVEDADADS